MAAFFAQIDRRAKRHAGPKIKKFVKRERTRFLRRLSKDFSIIALPCNRYRGWVS